MPSAPKYLTTEEVAERYHTTPATVRYWRAHGSGPVGYRLGRRVLYELSACTAWEEATKAAQDVAGAPRSAATR